MVVVVGGRGHQRSMGGKKNIEPYQSGMHQGVVNLDIGRFQYTQGNFRGELDRRRDVAI